MTSSPMRMRSGVRTMMMAATMAVAAVLGMAATAAAQSAMQTGGATSQPIGHYEFCQQVPDECAIRNRNVRPATMGDAFWRQIVSVNAAVNAAVKPMSDKDIYGRDEVWAYPEMGVGDCEDYVLEKRRILSGQGISLGDLLITVVRKPDGEGHAVLTVRTNAGDFILDNLTDEVKPWEATGYNYLKRQATDHTGRWVTIREGQTALVGAVQ